MTITSRTPRIATVAAVAATLASGSFAAAAEAPKVKGSGELVRISGGAQLRYDLTRTVATSRQEVVIAGRTARIRRFDQDGDRLYIATASRQGLRAGRSYRVTVRAAGRTVLNRRLRLSNR